MNWYSAHIVLYVKFKTAKQSRFPVWENIVLICARSEEAAFKKAEQYGRMAEGDDDGHFQWGEHPSEWVYAGVRKLTECSSAEERPEEGTELSYTEFELESLDAVDKLVNGEPVKALVNDRYRTEDSRNTRSDLAAKPGKRKRA